MKNWTVFQLQKLFINDCRQQNANLGMLCFSLSRSSKQKENIKLSLREMKGRRDENISNFIASIIFIDYWQHLSAKFAQHVEYERFQLKLYKFHNKNKCLIQELWFFSRAHFYCLSFDCWFFSFFPANHQLVFKKCLHWNRGFPLEIKTNGNRHLYIAMKGFPKSKQRRMEQKWNAPPFAPCMFIMIF